MIDGTFGIICSVMGALTSGYVSKKSYDKLQAFNQAYCASSLENLALKIQKAGPLYAIISGICHGEQEIITPLFQKKVIAYEIYVTGKSQDYAALASEAYIEKKEVLSHKSFFPSHFFVSEMNNSKSMFSVAVSKELDWKGCMENFSQIKFSLPSQLGGSDWRYSSYELKETCFLSGKQITVIGVADIDSEKNVVIKHGYQNKKELPFMATRNFDKFCTRLKVYKVGFGVLSLAFAFNGMVTLWKVKSNQSKTS